MRLFNDTDFSDFKGLPKIRFKGSTSKTTSTRNIPAQTTQEAALQNSATNYANEAGTTASGL